MYGYARPAKRFGAGAILRRPNREFTAEEFWIDYALRARLLHQ
jgi:hypothetical protein